MGEKEGEKNKVGRPSEYNHEVADLICTEIACSSKSLKTICSQEGMPCVKTIMNWLRTNEEFLQQYTRAKQEQADFMVEEMIEIADDGSNDLMTIIKGNEQYETENKEVTNRSKLRVETRKWIASKLKPKKYGDKLELNANVKNENVDLTNLNEEELAKLIELQNKIDPNKG